MLGKVAIAGLGYSAFSPTSCDSSYRELTYEAAVKAYTEVGIEPKDIDSFVCTSEDFCEGYSISDEYCNDQLGAVLKPAQTISGDAIHSLAVGVMHILTGKFDIVAVQALSKISNMKSVPKLLNFALDPILNRPFDVHSSFISGMELNRFLHDKRATREQCAMVSVKNRANALLNPVAGYGAEITVEDVLASEPISEPLRRLDMAQSSDGAIVLVLASENTAKSLTKNPIWIEGIGWASDSPSLESRNWDTSVSTKIAADMAYKMANIACPAKEIDLAEVTDEVSYKELEHLEALRLFEPGEAGVALEYGKTSIQGELPVNTSGGDLGVGHLFEASGAQKVAEIVLQLRGEAGKRQIQKAHRGVAQAWRGDPTTSSAVVVLSND